jgi:hypothetical protein
VGRLVAGNYCIVTDIIMMMMTPVGAGDSSRRKSRGSASSSSTLIGQLRGYPQLSSITSADLEECAWKTKQRIFLTLLASLPENVGSERGGWSKKEHVEQLANLLAYRAKERLAEKNEGALPQVCRAAEEKMRRAFLDTVGGALVALGGQGTHFTSKQLARDSRACRKAFSFLCAKVASSSRLSLGASDSSARKSLCFTPPPVITGDAISDRQVKTTPQSFRNVRTWRNSCSPVHSSGVDATSPPKEASPPLSEEPPDQGGEHSISEQGEAALPPKQPAVFRTSPFGPESAEIGHRSRPRRATCSCSCSSELETLRREKDRADERIEELQALYDDAIATKAKSGSTSYLRLLRSQTRQLRRHVANQMAALDASAVIAQEVGAMLARLHRAIEPLVVKQSVDAAPPSNGAASLLPGGTMHRSALPAWQDALTLVKSLSLRLEWADREAGRAMDGRMYVPSSASAFLGNGLPKPSELQLRRLHVNCSLEDVGAALPPRSAATGEEANTSTSLPQYQHLNIAAVGVLENSVAEVAHKLSKLLAPLHRLEASAVQLPEPPFSSSSTAHESETLSQRIRDVINASGDLLLSTSAFGISIPACGSTLTGPAGAADAGSIRLRDLAKGIQTRGSGIACLQALLSHVVAERKGAFAAAVAHAHEVQELRHKSSVRAEALRRLAESASQSGHSGAQLLRDRIIEPTRSVLDAYDRLSNSTNATMLRRGGAGKEVAELLQHMQSLRDGLNESADALDHTATSTSRAMDRLWREFERAEIQANSS